MLKSKKPFRRKMPDISKWWDLNINFFYGCSPVSTGCENCWAASSAYDRNKAEPLAQYKNLITTMNRKPRWNGVVETANNEERWRKQLQNLKAGSIVTLEFMGDLCYPPGPSYLEKALALPVQYQHLMFVITTKRPERLRNINNTLKYPNLIVLASVEDQLNADIRLHHITQLQQQDKTNNVGVCYEPALDMVDMFRAWPVECDECGETIKSHTQIQFINQVPKHMESSPVKTFEQVPRHITGSGPCGNVRSAGSKLPRWIIVGAETGPNSRKFEYEWAERALEFCQVHNFGKEITDPAYIKFFYKFGKDDLYYWKKVPQLHGKCWIEKPSILS